LNPGILEPFFHIWKQIEISLPLTVCYGENMTASRTTDWQEKQATPDQALARIEPGMNIFLGTGAAEPRTLVKRLMASDALNLQDLTLIQILSFGDAISLEELRSNKYRLKTFFSGWVASDAITAGRVDLIPSRFSAIPWLIKGRQLPVDVAIIQITPPDADGLCSLGIAVDVGRRVMAQASVVIGEINANIPRTYGDTFVSVGEFDLLVESTEPAPVFPCWPVDDVYDRVAANVASVIEDGSCLGFTFGPLFEALPRYLAGKRDLGIHTPFITDAVMALVKSGAVTNRRKTPSGANRFLLCHGLTGPDALAGPQPPGGISEHRKGLQPHGNRQELAVRGHFSGPQGGPVRAHRHACRQRARSPPDRARPWIFSTVRKYRRAGSPSSPCPAATSRRKPTSASPSRRCPTS
jgi:hypothetical protein